MPTPADDLNQAIEESAESIRRQWNRSPRFAIVLGTGAGPLADEIEIEQTINYGTIPNFPLSTALGHKGRLVCGTLSGKPILAMQGRFHLYEGYPVDQATLPIHVMNRLGVEMLFVSNASGGINPQFASGEIMLIESHIDLMFRTSPNLVGSLASERAVNRADAYDVELIEQALRCGRRRGFTVHRGIYTAMLGPNFETRAEYRMIRKIGGDVAGMSTVPEVTVAAKYGMRVLAMSIVTNIAKPDILKATSGEEVIEAAKTAAPNLKALVVDAIERA